MRRRSGGSYNRFVVGAAVLSAVVTFVIASWPSDQRYDLSPPVAEAAALRSPDLKISDRQVAAVDEGSITGGALSDEQQRVLFIPYPTYPQIAASPAPEPVHIGEAAPSKAAPVQHVAAPGKTAAANAHHAQGRPGAVLNDGQIANIKRRLNLTPDQEQMWPAVETALRSLSYSKKTREARKPSFGDSAAVQAIAAIDPTGPDVQQLKSAAVPLVMSFSDDQKRELRSLAHIVGLEKLASQF
ncbi:MAG TPA: Spy/CpxP family protein refolding chaperone [Xanthobacteraceae bacterium]|jgi:hypothetical protein|nr:Spy/CpxP family protein refolding chaperone [Xanthobacteraceae bacterium]